MKNRLLRTALAIGTCLSLAGCSSSPVNLWPFGGEKAKDRSRTPVDATEYRCDGGKRFHVRFLEGGNAAWLILPEREIRLDKTEAGTRYSNGIAVLEINGSEATLTDGSASSFAGCKVAAAAN